MPLGKWLWIWGEVQFASKIWITISQLKKIFKVESERFAETHRKISSDEKLYWWTPTYNWFFDKRNKFTEESLIYILSKYKPQIEGFKRRKK